jgi:hypothetical protein
VNASFQELTHGELGKSHAVSFSGLNLGEAVFRAYAPTGGPNGISPRTAQASPVKWRAYSRRPGAAQEY